jgi:hypothetical protein
MKEYIAQHPVEIILSGTGIMFVLAITLIILVYWYSKTKSKKIKIAFFTTCSLIVAMMISALILSIYIQ